MPQPVCLQYSADTRAFHETLCAAELLPLERALVAQALGVEAPAEPIPSALSVADARALLRCEVRAAIERRVEALAPGANLGGRYAWQPADDPVQTGSPTWERRNVLWRLEDVALEALRGALLPLLAVAGLDVGRDRLDDEALLEVLDAVRDAAYGGLRGAA